MFGGNKIEKRIDGPGHVLDVKEIFYTIQGEGPYAGRCAVFIRLAGCHLACTFCDTQFEDGTPMAVADIVKTAIEADPFATRKSTLIVLTGGEPTRQPIDALVYGLMGLDYVVQIETAGSFWRPCMAHESCPVVVSPKTSFVDPTVASHAAAWKYVIDHRYTYDDDGIPVTDTQGRMHDKRLFKPDPLYPSKIYLSPLDAYNVLHTHKNKIMVGQLAMKHGYVAGIQLHKELGDLP